MAPGDARAAEFVLRAQCETTGPVVTLGDVADVVTANAAEAERLAAIELFPAPPPGRQHFVRQREVQDLLLVRGLNLAEHRFSGASQVAISRAGTPEKTVQEKPVSAATERRAKRQLSEAIVKYLNQNAESEQPWSVELQLDEGQSRLVAGVGSEMVVGGGQSPWVGNQRFEVTVTPPGQPPARFGVDAQVALPASVVVASRSLPRGAVLSEADVELQRGASVSGEAQPFGSIDEVVGTETTRAIGAGIVLDRDSVRSPLLIRRSEVITVTAVAGGVRVTTNARAKTDGSLGDLIPVESLHDRATYFARVCGLRQAEVYAGAVKTRHADATPVARTKQGTLR